MATASFTRSLRQSAAWLLASLAAPILGYVAASPSLEPQGATLVLSRTSAERSVRDFATIEFAWPKELTAESCLLVIGSLDTAAIRTAVTISARSGASPDLYREPDAEEPLREPPVSRVQLAAWNVPRHTGIDIPSDLKSVSRVFFLQTAPQRHQPVTTRLAAESDLVRVWEEEGGNVSTSPAQLSWLIERLQHDILPELGKLYGEIADVDCDGKLAVCLTDRLADLPTNDSPVEGLVQANDFHVDLPRPYSNQADVLFLSRSLQPGAQTLAVLAHEAAHLAVFSRRFDADPHGFRPEDDWLNEGLAHFAEVHCSGSWTNLEARIIAFQQYSESSPLVVIDADREGFWRDPGSRGAAWSFFSWIAEEHGVDAIRKLAHHPGVGCAKIESVLQQPFAEIFRRWSVSQAVANSPARGGRDEKKITLCGTTNHTRWLHRPTKSAACWRIELPADRQVQVTLVDLTARPPRIWIVR